MLRSFSHVLLLALALAWLPGDAGIVCGYFVRPAVSLEKLAKRADVIFKGTVVSSERVKDKWFTPYPDFITLQTVFKVVSVVKGEGLAEQVTLRHYDRDPNPQGCCFAPQFYHFEVGRTYLVFAKRHGNGGFLRQIWKFHTTKRDQGFVLCADGGPVAGSGIKAILWRELTATLASPRADDVVYAIEQLDEMSEGNERWAWAGLSDFDRNDVLSAVGGLMTSNEDRIAQAAIRMVGSHNPYLSEERTIYWLATVGSGEIPGIGTMNAKMDNPGGRRYWKDLVACADSRSPSETRSMAILALGLTREPLLAEPLGRWLADPDAGVRASAALLLADFPGPETRKQLTILAGDTATEVRACAARAAGFSQQIELVDLLAQVLADKEAKVRRAAAMSLLSFSPKVDRVAAVFRAQLKSAEFQPLFLLALARECPEDYLDALATVVEKKTEPTSSWGGQIPAFTAWEILFRYLQAQPVDRVRSGKLDRYLDAMEKVGQYSSSEPRDIYAFYLQRGMTEQAKEFRREAKKAFHGDLEHFFNEVDANPARYQRAR